MESSSSSNHGEEYQHPYMYPYPSHVFVPSFVSVKLSGSKMYGVWKTQMLCLLESHDMIGFIDGTLISPQEISVLGNKVKEGDYMLWRRSDALVKGWILGSLSQQLLVDLLDTNYKHFSAKDVWDQLQTLYGPLVQQIAADVDAKEDIVTIEVAGINNTRESSFRRCKIKGRRKDEKNKITINGNTALHVAVGTTKKTYFLEYMFNLAAKDNPQLDMRNSEGSTLLHVAAIVGNTEAAKILVEKNRDLLFAKDNEGQTPLARALSNMHTDTYLYLLGITSARTVDMATLFVGTSGDELLVNAISSKDFNSALVISEHYHFLHSDVVLMAIAQNFPPKLNSWESIVYTFITSDDYLGKCYGINKLLRRVLRILLQWPFKYVDEKAQVHDKARYLLQSVCRVIKSSQVPSSYHQHYTNPILEATRQNAYEVVVMIVSVFVNAIWSANEDGHYIIQFSVINRSEKVYNLVYQMSEHRNVYRTIKDPCGNNLLHLAARLAPPDKLNHISGAALQIQYELQWFKEIEGFVCPLNILQKYSSGETPEMVFTIAHKELVVEGEKWMKATAESYTITAALITTVVFAAAITVPGGNNQNAGIPIFTNDTAFTIFAVADAISLFTAVTSLLMFLSILTTRFAQKDFLFTLPTKLIIGLATLFISTTAIIVAFGATLFLVFGQRKSWILILIAALTCLPITSFVTLQFPLIADLTRSTYGRSIFGKKRYEPFY